MTTIAAVSHGGTYAVAADSLETSNGTITSTQRRKLLTWEDSDLVVAVAGFSRMLNLISSMVEPPDDVWDFAAKLRTAIKSDEFEPCNKDHGDGGPRCWCFGCCVIGNDGCWEIGSDFHVREVQPSLPYGAGTGGEFAQGAMHLGLLSVDATDGLAATADQIVVLGVSTGMHFDIHSGGRILLATRGGGVARIGPCWVDPCRPIKE